MPSNFVVGAGEALLEGGHDPHCAHHIIAPSSTEVATRTVADVCRSLPRPGQSVDLSAAQMAGAQRDTDVPARRC